MTMVRQRLALSAFPFFLLVLLFRAPFAESSRLLSTNSKKGGSKSKCGAETNCFECAQAGTCSYGEGGKADDCKCNEYLGLSGDPSDSDPNKSKSPFCTCDPSILGIFAESPDDTVCKSIHPISDGPLKITRTSVNIGQDGNPIVTYRKLGFPDSVNVIFCHDKFCRSQPTEKVFGSTAPYASAIPFFGSNAKLKLDAAGVPTIVYAELTTGAMKMLRCFDQQCNGSPMVVDVVSSADAGGTPGVGWIDFVFDPDTNWPMIVYRLYSNQDIYYIRCLNPICSESTGPQVVFSDPSINYGDIALWIKLYSDSATGDMLPVIACPAYQKDVIQAAVIAKCLDKDCTSPQPMTPIEIPNNPAGSQAGTQDQGYFVGLAVHPIHNVPVVAINNGNDTMIVFTCNDFEACDSPLATYVAGTEGMMTRAIAMEMYEDSDHPQNTAHHAIIFFNANVVPTVFHFTYGTQTGALDSPPDFITTVLLQETDDANGQGNSFTLDGNYLPVATSENGKEKCILTYCGRVDCVV